ncbi:hypothetical protein HanXRQr2_Chr13g0590791 [Helianthus annuus]|uniref:Uncharacterized protein n=1 Tax=Helianthus annuus TaxID=4232 RepID=A0A9K3HAH3_HELAN|nr:hypothetical protein HanXRQr2_Chr13g0590791 [Helianthus annuus]KAJ0849455.1 hypothetical protein HanPSC8_Chr13g0568931 [Helianthus annuus]
MKGNIVASTRAFISYCHCNWFGRAIRHSTAFDLVKNNHNKHKIDYFWINFITY